ncbi:MAG: pyridoxal phosphate-dependent aminotransferase [Gemmatimonadaceae bacterium]
MAAPAVAGRFQSLKPSATVEMSERVRVARAQGREVLAMSSGDPNLETDPRIIESAHRALRGGATHYSSSFGERSLRDAIAKRELQRSGVTYDPDDIIVTPGGKFALLSALMGIIEPGDEVLVPQPGWVSYGPCVRLAGGDAVPVPMLDHLDLAVMEKAITHSTRAVIVNSPVNPTGRVLTRWEVEQIVELARTRNLWIIFDQVYTDLVYEAPVSFPQAAEDGYERTLVVDSLSKSFGMTGWRLGFLAMPPGLARFVVKFIQHSIYCVPAFIQAAGARALELAPELLPQYRAQFHGRVIKAAAALDAIEGLSIVAPDAGFFLFPHVGGDDVAIARRWLDDLDIAVLPGSAFGLAGAGHLRISLSGPEADLDVALTRIAQAGMAR